VRVMAVKPGVSKDERELGTGDKMKVHQFLVL
jgi:hypothetical protein